MTWQAPFPSPVRSVVWTQDTAAIATGPGIASPVAGPIVGVIVNAQGAPVASPLTFVWEVDGVAIDSGGFALGAGETEHVYYPLGSPLDGAAVVDVGDVLDVDVTAIHGATGPVVFQLLIG